MYKFGRKSEEVLAKCHYGIIKVMREALKHKDFSCICSFRDKLEQNNAFENNFSKVKWPNSKHNCTPSKAIDVRPFPLWRYPNKEDATYGKDLAEWYVLGTIIMMCAKQLMVPLRWGGDWDGDFRVNDQNFDDLGHFEIVLIGD